MPTSISFRFFRYYTKSKNISGSFSTTNITLIDTNMQVQATQFQDVNRNYATLEKLYANYVELADSIEDENFNIIENLMKKFKWGLDAVKLITASVKETPLAELKSLFVTYNELFTNVNAEANKPFANEIILLGQMLGAYSSWQNTTKDMLNDHRNRKKETEKKEKELEVLIKKEESSFLLSNKLNVINKKKDRSLEIL